jgi:hypothetical protein
MHLEELIRKMRRELTVPRNTSPLYNAALRGEVAAEDLLKAAKFALTNYRRNLHSEEKIGIPFMGDDEHEAIRRLSEAIVKAETI